MGKLSINQKGFGVVGGIIILVVVVAIGGVGYAVYKNHNRTTPPTNQSAKNASNTSAQTTSSVAVNATCLSVYHDTNLCRFASNSSNLDKTAYTATISETSPSGTLSSMTMKSDGKGNTETVTSSGGQQISTVSLSGNTYFQSGAGTTWIEYPAGTAGSPSTSDNPTSSMNLGVDNTGITYKSLGTTSCGDLTCYKYQVLDSATPGTTQFAWFDKTSYLLREWQATDSTTGTVTMNITYQPVNITAPSPVQTYGTAN